MKNIFLILYFISIFAEAKKADLADQYSCYQAKPHAAVVHPVWMHRTKDNLTLGICGQKAKGINNFTNVKLQIFSKAIVQDKPFYENNTPGSQFLAVESTSGLLLIEKVKVKDQFIELIKHEILCDANSCQVKKETCAILNKLRQKKIYDSISDKKIKSRMKKAGCLTK
jgi:hypothetical protein